jgi:dolichol-phosphate mannosyltransferase
MDHLVNEAYRLAIIVPLGNEIDTIHEFLDRTLQQIGQEDRLMCVLDTYSKDGTLDVVRDYAERFAQVECLFRPENRSVVDAYFAGYREAYDSGAEWILEMDGGLSHLPEEIPTFLAKAGAGYEFVGGSRFMPGGAHASPWQRVVVSWLGTVLARCVLGSTMTDMTSGFELFTRKTMKAVLDQGVESKANFFQTEIRHLMHQYKWAEVPIRYSNDRPQIGRSAVRESLRILYKLRRAKSKRG